MRLSDLAHRPDFALGPLSISPARRLIEGPEGRANLEPVIMQVFLILAEGEGQVVTRADLFDQVWGGVMVGDDSLNRAVAKVRKHLAEVAPGSFEVETIPRTGYRLLGDASMSEGGSVTTPARAGRVSRRTAVVGGALVLAGAAGAGLWLREDRRAREYSEQMAAGVAVLDYGDLTDAAAPHFRRAMDVRPNDARALGLYAYSLATRIDDRSVGRPGAAVEESERAVRAALESAPGDPNTQLAQILLERSTLDLAANEDRLRAVIARDPDNIYAMRHLWNLLQSSGRSREAMALVERAIALKPLAATNNYPRAQLLWILGRHAEADRVIDRAMQYWPKHRWVRFARFIILAFTGRERAARAMLDGKGTAPQEYGPAQIALWRVNLAALEDRSPAKVAAALSANLDAAKQHLGLSSQAIMALAALGEIDAAFEIANAVLLFNPTGDAETARPGQPVKSTAWIFAPWLFTPPLAPLRADPRFKTLCDGIGLTDYWTSRGIRPDYRIGTP